VLWWVHAARGGREGGESPINRKREGVRVELTLNNGGGGGGHAEEWRGGPGGFHMKEWRGAWPVAVDDARGRGNRSPIAVEEGGTGRLARDVKQGIERGIERGRFVGHGNSEVWCGG
jgi:hypothetical protein